MKHTSQSARIKRSIGFGIVTLVSGVFLLLLAGIGNFITGSGDLTYTSLHYDAQVLNNGDLRVKQKVTMHLEERENDDNDTVPWRQLFQQYSSDQLPGDISDISVTDEHGTKFSQTEPMLPSTAVLNGVDWNAEMADKWYIDTDASDDNGKKVTEIGWNIPETTSADALTFTVSMTFDNAVVGHPDVAEFQWEPISTANSVYIEHLSGTLKFPKGITSKNSWAWLHYEGSDSTTTRGKNGTLKFSADGVRPGNYVALRTMFDSSAVSPARTKNTAAKQRILDEEAQKELQWQDQLRTTARLRLTLWIVTAIVVLALSILSIYQAVRSHKGSQYHGDLDYWREPPAMSPAAAANLLKVMDPSKGKSDDITSATILSLASKKAIVLLPGESVKYRSLKGPLEDPNTTASTIFSSTPLSTSPQDEETTTIAILPAARGDRKLLHLSSSEDSALRALLAIADAARRDSFDLVELSDFFEGQEKAAGKVYKALSGIQTSGEREFNALHATTSVAAKRLTPSIVLMCVSIFALCIFAVFGQFLLGGALGLTGLLIGVEAIIWGSNQVLNSTGQELAGTVLGLRNYLLDFSTFQDRKVADLALWDRYLVYATAFGIAKEAGEQLALAQPQVSDQEWLDSNAMTYPLLYSFYRPWAFSGGISGAGTATALTGFGNGLSFGSIGDQLSSNLGEIQSTIGSAMGTSSSSGGGFSGGGFGGGGGGVGGGSFGGR